MKMRIHFMAAITAAVLFLGVGSAQAVLFSFENITGGSGDNGAVLPGDSITAELWVDTETEVLQAWFMQVNQGGGTASAASVEPFLFVGGIVASPLGTPGINNFSEGDASGQFAFTVGPPNGIAAGQAFKYGEISLTAGDSNISIDISEAGGAVGGPGGQDLVAEGLVTFGIIQVPEPSVALMGFAALGAIGVMRHRSLRS